MRLLALAAALAPSAARAGADLILATHDTALASALSVAVSPRGLSVMELEAPFTRVADVEAARREVVARDAVAVVWLCDDDAGAHALCFCAHDGRFVAKPVSVTSPLAPPDAAALALSVKLLLGAAPPPPAPAPAPPASPVAPPSRPVENAAPAPVAARGALGLTLAVLPLGTISIDGSGPTGPFQGGGDAAPAIALAPFFDYSLLPYLSIGVSPQITFNVKASGDASSATEYDVDARLTFWKGVSPRLVAFGRLSPGYSMIALPDAWTNALQPGAAVGTARGFLVGGSGGVEYLLAPTAFLVLEVGYQLGFQRATVKTNTGNFEVEYGTRYPHVGLGLGVAVGK